MASTSTPPAPPWTGPGPVAAVTDASGGVTHSYAYDSYGATTETTASSVANPWRYTGQDQDVATGLYKVGARYYQPELGRLTTTRPVGAGGELIPLRGSLVPPQVTVVRHRWPNRAATAVMHIGRGLVVAAWVKRTVLSSLAPAHGRSRGAGRVAALRAGRVEGPRRLADGAGPGTRHPLGAVPPVSAAATDRPGGAARSRPAHAGGFRRRHVPDDAPVDFVPLRWRPYLDSARAAGDENRFKHYWELWVLFALQVRPGARRSLSSPACPPPSPSVCAPSTRRPPRPFATPWSSTPASTTGYLQDAIDAHEPTGIRSATRPSPISARPDSRRSTRTGAWSSTSPASTSGPRRPLRRS